LRFEFRPWFYTVISVGGILVNILLTIYYVLILKQGVLGALIASAIAYLLFFAITIIYVFRKYGIGFSFPISKRLLKYGFPLIGTGIAVWILTSSDRYFIAHYADLTSVGIYAVGMKLANFLGMLGGTIQLAWGPFAMSIQYNEGAKEIYSKIFKLFFLFNLLGVFFISMFAIDILKVFTQPSYYNAKAVVPFLCFSTIFWTGYFIVAIGINITKKLQHTVWITVTAAIINISLNFIFTPIWGAIGAAFCLMIANLFILVFTYVVSQKYYFVPYNSFIIIILYVLSFIIIGVTYYLELRIALRIIISSLYFIALLIYLHKISLSFPAYKKFFHKFKLLNI
jgi:O-antigen/teichoic acid export membrane protein